MRACFLSLGCYIQRWYLVGRKAPLALPQEWHLAVMCLPRAVTEQSYPSLGAGPLRPAVCASGMGTESASPSCQLSPREGGSLSPGLEMRRAGT